MRNMLVIGLTIAIVSFMIFGGDVRDEVISFALDVEEDLTGDTQSRPIAAEIATLSFAVLPRANYPIDLKAFVDRRRAILRVANADTGTNAGQISAIYQAAFEASLKHYQQKIANFWRMNYNARELGEIMSFIKGVSWLKVALLCESAYRRPISITEMVFLDRSFTERDMTRIGKFAKTPTGRHFLSNCRAIISAYVSARNGHDQRTATTARQNSEAWMRQAGLDVPGDVAATVTADRLTTSQPAGLRLQTAER